MPSDLSHGVPPRGVRRYYVVVILLCVCLVYAQCLRFDFVTYDDYELVYQNGDFLSHVANVAASFATHAFTTHRAESGYYRPLLLVSYIADYQLWGLQPLGYHLTNIILHCCAGVVVFLLLERLLRERTAALFGSLLFSLHPVQTESVAWVAGRNDLLLGLFISLMLLSYLYYRAEGGGRRRLYGILAVVAFGFALFTKESAAFYILLLPACDLCLTDTPVPLKERARSLAPFLAVALIYMIARWSVIGELIGAERLYGTVPLAERLVRVPAIIAEHCALVLSPLRLSVVHPVEDLLWLSPPWSAAAALVPIALLAALWYAWKKDRVCWFGLLLFLVGLIPLLGILPLAVPVLEHRLYVPLIGVAILAARALDLLLARRRIRSLALGAAFLVMCLAGILSYLRLPVWTDSAALWHDAIAKAPGVSRSYVNLAGYYFEHQQYDSTIQLMRRYIALQPADPLAYEKLRQTYFLAGRYDEAAQVSRQLILRSPADPKRYLEAGLMYERLGRYDSAAALYRGGLRADSGNVDLHLRLGEVYRQTNALPQAELEFRHALELFPGSAAGWFGLGAVSAARSDTAGAIASIERGLRFGAPSPEMARLLCDLYSGSGYPEKAREIAEKYHL